MSRINNHLLKSFFAIFTSLFLTLFFLASVAIFIRISKITSIIKLNFLELGQLYAYVLPKIMIYTLPLTFFIALTISLFKMSQDNELTVVFSLGYDPKKIAKFFLIFSSLVSAFLLVNSILLVPLSKQMYQNFVEFKQTEARLNIKATEFGQKFSNWLVFINKSDKENNYKDIVMFSKDQEKNEDNFILAKSASVSNEAGTLRLKLNDGKAFMVAQNDMQQIDYKTMKINQYQKTRPKGVETIIDYWKEMFDADGKDKAKDFATYFLISLFPVLSFIFAMSAGIINLRYDKGNIYAFMFAVVILFYSLTYSLSSIHPFGSIFIVMAIFYITGRKIFKKRILSRY